MRRSVSLSRSFSALGQRLAVEIDLALAGRQEAGDGARQRRLAGPRFTHHGHSTAARQLHRHIVQHLDHAAVAGIHVVDAQRDVVADRFLLGELAHRPERLGVVLLGLLQHLAGRRLLHFLAVAQHHDAVGHLRHHGQVMGDVDRGRVELLDDVAHGGQHLDLGGHIERGGRFVEDDEVGPAGHGHGRHGALQLAARHLMRIAVADGVRLRQLQALVEIARIGLRLFAGHDAVAHRRLDGLVDQLVGRIEGGGGTLRHIGDARAPQVALLVLAGLAQVDAVEHDGAAGDAAAGPGEAHGGQADGRLAGP